MNKQELAWILEFPSFGLNRYLSWLCDQIEQCQTYSSVWYYNLCELSHRIFRTIEYQQKYIEPYK